MQPSRSTSLPGRRSFALSWRTTAFGVDAGACNITARTVVRRQRKSVKPKNSSFGKGGRTPRLCSTANCVGWCQFGSPDELPCIHYERAYLATSPTLPDWCITCFFSGKGYRGKGVAYAALNGAVEQIEQLGGGRVEGYPEDTEDRKASPAFLFNGALSTLERLGLEQSRLIGKHKWVVARTVP